ncbi:MAG: riboflavin kinase, partial [Aquiluna sp.]
LASLSPQEFVTRHLLPLRPKLVLVGEGFRFGAKGAGNIEVLRAEGKKHGFVAKQVATVMLGDTKVSASKIRSLLDAGKVAEANLLLGRNHATEGIVEHGRKLGRELGFPTANIARDAEGYLPGDGVYAGYLICEGVRYPAAHSVGTNDSIAAVPRLLESHVIGRDDLDLYDKQVRCEYVEQVRGWAKFSSVDELTQQIARDVADASAILEL